MTERTVTAKTCFVFPLVLLVGLADPGHGQQPVSRADSVRRADSIRVARHRLSTVVVNETRLSSVDERTPSRVDDLDVSRAIQGPEAIANALLALPGASAFNDQGARLQPQIMVRGFAVSSVVGSPQGVGVFLNGVRVNEPDAQEVDFDLLPSAAVDRATLVRGSNVLFGRNSLGGTILFTTRRGGDRPEAELTVGGGSYGDQVLTATAGGKRAGIDGFVAFTGENEIGWRHATSANARNVFATIGHQWGPSHESGDIALDLGYAHDRIFEAGSLPLSYLQINPRINYTPGDFFDPDAANLTLRGNEPFAGGIFRGTVFGRRNNVEQFNGNVPPPNTDGFTRNRSGGTTLEWTRPLTIGAVPVGITFGGEYSRESAHIVLLSVGAGAPDSTTTDATIHQDNAATYAQAILSVARGLDLAAGLRADYVHIPYRDGLDATNDGTSMYRRLSPEVGLSYQVTDALKIFAAYKSGFRAPAPLELACANANAPCSLPFSLGNDPPLAPVTTHDYEGGANLERGRHLALSLDAFWTDVSNDIVLGSPNLTQSYFLNAPKTRRGGVEVSGAVPLSAGFRAFGSYGYVAATYQSTVQIATSDTNPQPTKPGDIIPLSPLHRGRVGLTLDRVLGPVALSGIFDVKAYSGQYMRGDESNQRQRVPGYAVAGFGGSAVYNRYTLTIGVENLFDRSNYTYGIEAQNQLGPYGSNQLPNDAAPVEPFYTPGYARRISVTVSTRM